MSGAEKGYFIYLKVLSPVIEHDETLMQSIPNRLYMTDMNVRL